jgi:hypothetical protein
MRAARPRSCFHQIGRKSAHCAALLFLLQRALSVFNMLAWPGLANAMLGTFRRRLPPSMAAMQRHAGRRPMLLCMATAGASTIAILAQSHANAACVSSDEEAEQAGTAAADKKKAPDKQALERCGAWAALHLHAQLR